MIICICIHAYVWTALFDSQHVSWFVIWIVLLGMMGPNATFLIVVTEHAGPFVVVAFLCWNKHVWAMIRIRADEKEYLSKMAGIEFHQSCGCNYFVTSDSLSNLSFQLEWNYWLVMKSLTSSWWSSSSWFCTASLSSLFKTTIQ